MPKYIGVAGQMQAGKDTLADYLYLKINENKWKWRRNSIAFGVKKAFCDYFNVDLDFIEKWKVIPEPPPGFEMPVRQSLQFIGDGFRKIKPDVWLKPIFENEIDNQIISDVRYINEFVRFKQAGGINILIYRPDKLNDDPNESESQIRVYLDWCMENLCISNDKFIDLNKVNWSSFDGAPYRISDLDLFVCNSGTKEDFYKLIDEYVVDFCANYYK